MSLYVVTLVVHVIFMNYVLAGTALLFLRKVFRRHQGVDTLVELLRDWLPFALSAAITAGIAPLLFVQILYEKRFYTANLLLFHRWMLILPALILAFYLLYALKTSFVASRPRLFAVVAAIAFGLFLFTGLSWTENYLLARNNAVWAEMYASKSMLYRNPEILPRLLLWCMGAVPTLALLLRLQLFRREKAGVDVDVRDLRAVARLGIGGLFLAVICAMGYGIFLGPAGREHVFGPMALPWSILALVGLVLQGFSHGARLLGSSAHEHGKWLLLGSAGLVFTILGTTVVREVMRIAVIDFASLYPDHARAASMGGAWLFVAFFAVNAGLGVWAIRTGLSSARAKAT